MVIGHSGSGKSVLAGKLGRKYKCKVLYLDCVHWLPGWKERDKKEEEDIISGFLDKNNSWVIDGNYVKKCYERRLSEATNIIYLLFPRRICLYRIIKRYFKNRGKTRKSMAAGCEEKIDMEFIWWVLYKGRDKKHRQNYKKVCRKYPEKVIVLKKPSDVKRFCRALKI